MIKVEFLEYTEDVYDITVENTHSFFADDILVHNCGEISLRAFQFCNLATINAGNVDDQADFNDRARAASFISTLQASYTNFHYLRDIWKKTTEKEALIGVSMTGIASGPILSLNMEEASKIVVEENARVSALIGIKPAARCTTVKPEGTSSLLLGTSSGIHPWHDEYYIRRVSVQKSDAIFTYLNINHPELLEDSALKPKVDAYICVPQKAPKGAITRNETALELLNRVSRVWSEWVKPGHRKGANMNNVSTTVTIKPTEWEDVGDWMWKNRDNFTALSVLPHSDHTYTQAPYETISEHKYYELAAALHKVNLDNVVELQDDTSLKEEVACGGGACEVT